MTERRKSNIVWLSGIFMFAAAFLLLQHHFDYNALAANSIKVPASVTGSNVNIRTKAGRTQAKLMVSNKAVTVSKGQAVTIIGQSTVSGEIWYRISFLLNKKTYTGYILSDYVSLTLKTAVKASVTSKTELKVYKKADGTTYLKVNAKVVSLSKGKEVTIIKETTVSGKKWFYVSFQSGSKTYKGYILASGTKFKAISATASSSPSVSASPSVSPEISEGTEGTVTAALLNVRMGAGAGYSVLTYNSLKVQLSKGTEVTILDSVKSGSTVWYYVSFTYKNTTLKGYVSASYISSGTSPSPSIKVSLSPSPSSSTDVLSDAEFEAALTTEGFPESYKASLRELHARYPLWQFKVFDTGYDWNTAITNENKLGKNLITNTKSLAWKSMETGAYNWSTDAFIPFDGSSWVTASKEALEYYMDPRNFLTTDGIFQFEYLSYMSDYQKLDGVESILKGTVMADAFYSYLDSAGNEASKTYGETFMDAAAYSQVSPFHLATRVKQEVITSSGFSSSASGNFSGYKGYYNFYNIGAYHSTAVNGAVINGLKFAKAGNGMSDSNKILYLIPWTNPYNAIVGGAKFIGNNYINKGQNTVYLQKFNLSSYSVFSHQYMANVEAAKSEGQKTYAAYKDFTDMPVIFYIPVYKNMPEEKCSIPSTVLNPNNWLESLSVTAQVMTPTFQITDSSSTAYTVFVDGTVDSVTIQAAAVSEKASVTGTGILKVLSGKNTFMVNVTAENGDVRSYTIYVIKE